jgi:hypothetical protein
LKDVFNRNINTAWQWNFNFIVFQNDLVSCSNVQPFVNFGVWLRVNGVPIDKEGLGFRVETLAVELALSCYTHRMAGKLS